MLGREETEMESANRGHLLLIQVKPREVPGAPVRLLCSPLS